ncbi:MAG: ATP-dependent helicase, partial [Clostridiaceae bacterium]|nr:ATP-dependent helicase [Clostridiaceae bacterium]
MTWQEFEQQFSIQLNEQQKQAVQTVEGPVLLLAVPGSGKTTVLVTRLGYMIHCKGIDPRRILTVTYTVAATKDMAARFAAKFGPELAEQLEFRTINGICAKVLQYYGYRTGKTPHQLLNDEKRIAGILAEIYQRVERVYPTDGDLKNIRTLITYIKNMMLGEDEIEALDEGAECKISVIYWEYCSKLKELQMIDYDDQMVYAYVMLKKIPWLLEYFQELYPYICVDEAQDTSKIQHAIIALLASRTENLFMVGDEDQSIYGFRAAYPEALLEFEQRHRGAKVLLMEENFRSDANIVAAADHFIQKNTLRHEKHMRASRESVQQIKEISVGTRKAQYAYLAKVAEGCTTEMSVLYREHECALPLIDLLERKGIPYRMRNAELTFFTHRVVQDISNIIRLAADPADTELFLQVYYKLNTYIRRQLAQEIVKISQEKQISVWDAAQQCEGVDGYVKGSIRSIQT